jgi:hypothetical protein
VIEADRTSQRLAAVGFLAVGMPAAIAILVSGGGLAMAPLLLLVLPILALGRAPGIETLERLRERIAQPRRHRPTSSDSPARAGFNLFTPRTGLLLANSLAERGPPPAPLTR